MPGVWFALEGLKRKGIPRRRKKPAKPDRCCDSDTGIGSFKGLHEWCYGHIGGLAEAICGRT